MSAEWVEPREDCPVCGAGLLVEPFVDSRRHHKPVKFCSYVGCEWSDHPELSPTCCSAALPQEQTGENE